MTSSTPAPAAPDTAPEPQVAGRAASLALLVVLFASFMDLLDVTIVTVAAPDIAANLSASEAELQWMLAAYVLALGSGLVTGGRVGDAYGRRRVFLVSLAGFALASAACALAPSAGTLIALRALQGLAGGFMVPQVFGIIRSSFAPAAMAKAFGAYGAVQGLASVAGPLLGGALVNADLWGLGWRTIFWINVPVAVLALALGVRFLPESHAPGRTRLDVVGALLAAVGVFLVLLPLVQGRDWGWPGWGWGLLVLGLVVLAGFLAYEQRLARAGGQPVLDPSLLSIRPFSAGLAAAVFFFGGLASFFLVLSIYLQLGTGRTAWETGLVILPYALGSIITSGAGVALAAKAGRALLITGSLTLAASQGLVVAGPRRRHARLLGPGRRDVPRRSRTGPWRTDPGQRRPRGCPRPTGRRRRRGAVHRQPDWRRDRDRDPGHGLLQRTPGHRTLRRTRHPRPGLRRSIGARDALAGRHLPLGRLRDACAAQGRRSTPRLTR